MTEPIGHTLLTQALRVISRALDAHRDASPWREIVAQTSGRRGPTTFAVAIYEGDRGHIVDRYTVRAHDGRFEVVERGRCEPPFDWQVSVEHLRSIVAEPDRYVDEPDKLDLAWVESRLGIRAAPKRAKGWRLGRVRRPT